jgi:hypothetical protein
LFFGEALSSLPCLKYITASKNCKAVIMLFYLTR